MRSIRRRTADFGVKVLTFGCCLGMLLAILLGTAVPAATASEQQSPELTETPELTADELRERGAAIYATQCADCHGERGEGVASAYIDPLIGDDSIGELSKRIAETMPEDAPENCVGADAEAVAAFIHYAFYSEAARIRNRPPRITLTHLTANQLRQSLADLYSHFTGVASVESARGLKGEYFDGSRFRSNRKEIDRIDPVIDFDWKDEGPGDGMNAEDFCVRWRGGLLVEETGRYEIVIRSTCAFICDLGRSGRELINNRVQSGDKTEFRRSIMLTAGRVLPIQIDLYQRKRKTEQPPARISLSWTCPGGTEQVIPARHLVPTMPPATFALQTKLPPDDRSYGYDRGLAIDRQWDDSTTAAAVEFGQIAVEELWESYRGRKSDESNEDRSELRRFLNELAEVAFRGPLDDVSRDFYIEQQLAQTEDDAEAIKRSVLVMLKSPRFLYPGLDRDRSQSQRVANRLALTLFDSLPADEWLIKLVRDEALQTEEQIRSAAQRMVNDYRTRGKTRELMHEWMDLGAVEQITKDQESFPEFSDELVTDLKASLDAFIDEVVWSETSDFRELLLADWAYTTPRLAAYYGEPWQPDGDLRSGELSKVHFSGGQRTGVLSHPYLMSRFAYPDSTSPIHRGVFLIRYLLGRTLRPPQEAFTPLSPDLHPEMTTRQRVELQTSPEGCQVCHQKINGLGFALENYDAVGRFRKLEREQPIDPAGHYTTRTGESVEFRGASELAHFVAASDDAHQAFVNRAFQHFVKQPIAAYGADQLETLITKFRNDNYHIRNLLIEVAVMAAMQESELDDEPQLSEES